MSGPRAFLIGHPVAHSRSPLLHGYWLKKYGLEGSYELVDVDPDKVGQFFDRFGDEGWAGGNVTVPHKVAVIPFLDRIDEAATAMGAVNTIWREGDALVGGNYDGAGFMDNLDELAPGWDVGARNAVILGAGGAARAAAYGLKQRGLSVALANRTVANAEEISRHFGGMHAHGLEDLPDLLATADILVNTTSLGMMGKPPLDLDIAPLKANAVVYDVVYVPLETQLLKDAKAKGHPTVDGLGMLLHQAVGGFHRWFGHLPEVTAELRELLIADIRAKTPGA